MLEDKKISDEKLKDVSGGYYSYYPPEQKDPNPSIDSLCGDNVAYCSNCDRVMDLISFDGKKKKYRCPGCGCEI